MTVAKGLTSGYLPLSAAIVGDRIADTLISKGREFYHGFTYSGHPVASAVALENLRIIADEKLVERTRDETGPYFKECLMSLLDHPLIGEVRSLGLIGAVEMVKDKASRTHFDDIGKAGTICRDHCIEAGVVLRAVRDVMVFSPALTVTKAEIDEIVQRLRTALDLTAKDVGIA